VPLLLLLLKARKPQLLPLTGWLRSSPGYYALRQGSGTYTIANYILNNHAATNPLTPSTPPSLRCSWGLATVVATPVPRQPHPTGQQQLLRKQTLANLHTLGK
jgi:hypothetical protein